MGFRKYLYEIDDTTGEARELNLDDYVLFPVADLDAKDAQEIALQRMSYAKKACETSDRFIWVTYSSGGLWCPEVPKADIPRMAFLATYLSYNGYLAGGNHRALNKMTVQPLVGLSVSRFYGFWNDMTKESIFYEQDGKIYADRKRFRKGNLRPAAVGKSAENGVYFTRLYTDAVRQLYQSMPAASARAASYIFQIIPFVNREFNIVCHNPLETDLDKVKPFTLAEFCDLVGYNKRNARRILSQLTGLRITVDGDEQPVVTYENYPVKNLTYGIFINPNLYYAGSDILSVELMGAFRRRDRIPDGKEG